MLFVFIFFHQINYQFYTKKSFEARGYLSCPIELNLERENSIKIDIITNTEYIESFSLTLYINETQIDQILIDRKSYELSNVFNNQILINFNKYKNIEDLNEVKISLSGKDKYGNRFKSYCEYTSLVLDI